MPYSPSPALRAWRGPRRGTLDAIAEACGAAGARATVPLSEAYVVRLVAEFQGFVRELHAFVALRTVALAGPHPRYQALLAEAVAAGRSIDRGNPDLRAVADDFANLGLAGLKARLAADDAGWSAADARRDRARHQQLIELRNALAHGNESQVERLHARGVVPTPEWAGGALAALDRIASALDRIGWQHLVQTYDREPW